VALQITSAVLTQFAGTVKFGLQELGLNPKPATPNLHERACGNLMGPKQCGQSDYSLSPYYANFHCGPVFHCDYNGSHAFLKKITVQHFFARLG
jgi:hypothetical protein